MSRRVVAPAARIDRVVRERPQRQPPAARADGRQQPARRCALTRSSSARCGGSSRIFSTALAALRFISSAPSTIDDPPAALAGVRRRKPPTPRTSSTTISLRSRLRRGSCARSTTRDRHGRRRRRGGTRLLGRHVEASRAACAEQAAALLARPSRKRAKRKASVALPMPRGPVSSQACGSRPEAGRPASSLSAAS